MTPHPEQVMRAFEDVREDAGIPAAGASGKLSLIEGDRQGWRSSRISLVGLKPSC